MLHKYNVHIVFCCWGSFCLFLICWGFDQEWFSFLSDAFSVFIEMVVWIFFFSLLMWFHCFSNVKLILHSLNIPNLAVIYYPSNILLDLISFYFVKNFCIQILEGFWSLIFLYSVCLVSVSGCYLIEWVRKYFLLSFLEESMYYWHYFLLKCLVELSVKSSQPGDFFVGRFLVQFKK